MLSRLSEITFRGVTAKNPYDICRRSENRASISSGPLSPTLVSRLLDARAVVVIENISKFVGQRFSGKMERRNLFEYPVLRTTITICTVQVGNKRTSRWIRTLDIAFPTGTNVSSYRTIRYYDVSRFCPFTRRTNENSTPCIVGFMSVFRDRVFLLMIY